MSQSQPQTVSIEGEDANAGYAAPLLDLIAAGVLLALSGLVMVASLLLPVPGAVLTAPGLLPFLAAASLAVMAGLLGLSALRRHRAGETGESDFGNRAEDRRTLALALTIATYLLALQLLAFQLYFDIGSVPLTLSAFEPVTIIALTALIHTSWRGPLWITSLVSVGWTLALSLAFQVLFHIPLPGGF